MARWVDALLARRVNTAGTVALLAVGTVLAIALADVTEGGGPLGPAGVFIALVLLVAAPGGPRAGLASAAIGSVLLWVVFTPPRWSLRIEDAADAMDVAGFVVVVTALNLALAGLTRARASAQTAHAQVAAMVQSAPVGMAFVDRELRYVDVNEAYAELKGRPVDELLDTVIQHAEVVGHVEDVLATGDAKLDVTLASFGDADRPVRALAGFYPVLEDGRAIGVGIVLREVSAEHQRDLLLERVSRLQELTQTLAAAGTTQEVVDHAVRMMASALGARAAVFTTVGGDEVRVEGALGYPDDLIERWCAFPLSEDVPLAEAIRTGAPVLCRSKAEFTHRWPHLTRSMVWEGAMSLAALPLRGESSTIGSIGLSFDHERSFEMDDVLFLMSAATACATAYERSAAFEAERDANERLAYLVDATAILSESLDVETTLQRLAEIAVPTLADWCAVHLVQGNEAVLMAIASEDPALTETVRDLSLRHPIPLGTPGVGTVVTSGRPMVLNRVTLEAVKQSTSDDELIGVLRRLRSIAIVPMKVRDTVIGTVMLSNVTDRDIEPADRQLAEELAARASQAITNARLFTDRARVASTLQASLMPPSPPAIPGVEVATRFVPALEGLDVGGDFYDVFRLGTIDDPVPSWAIVIGDVRGKGADAAAITGIARATIRATALDERSPAEMLSRLNQVLLAAASDDRFAAETGEPRFCTACVITVTPSAAGVDAVVAVGGHPLPFVLHEDGSLDQIGKPGGLIGVLPAPDLADVHVRLATGDALVLYTDGITERHAGRTFFDEEGLVDVLAECRGLDAVAIAERIELTARAFVDEAPKDDLCIVIARVTAGPPAGSALPDDESAVAIARSHVDEALADLGAQHVRDAALLLTSELVTNAVLHGSAPLAIGVRAVAGGIRIDVSDSHPSGPVRGEVSGDDEHGRGLLLVEALSARWGVDPRPPGKSVWFELDT